MSNKSNSFIVMKTVSVVRIKRIKYFSIILVISVFPAGGRTFLITRRHRPAVPQISRGKTLHNRRIFPRQDMKQCCDMKFQPSECTRRKSFSNLELNSNLWIKFSPNIIKLYRKEKYLFRLRVKFTDEHRRLQNALSPWLTHYRPAMPFGNRKNYFRVSF